MYKLVDKLEGEVFVLKVRETKVVYNHYAVKGVDKEGAVEFFKQKDYRKLCTKVTMPHYISDVEDVEQVLTAQEFRDLNNIKK